MEIFNDSKNTYRLGSTKENNKFDISKIII